MPTQVINFAFVPAHLRFFTIGVVALFWSTSALLDHARARIYTASASQMHISARSTLETHQLRRAWSPMSTTQ